MAPNCKQESYIRLRKKEFQTTGHKTVGILLMPSGVPVLKIKSVPTISGIDFVVFILSILSFWLAFEPITIFLLTIDWFENKRSMSNHGQLQIESQSRDYMRLIFLLNKMKQQISTIEDTVFV